MKSSMKERKYERVKETKDDQTLKKDRKTRRNIKKIKEH